MQGQLQGAPGLGLNPLSRDVSSRKMGEQHPFICYYLVLLSTAVLWGPLFLFIQVKEQGCEKASKPPLWSHVLSLIGVCLSPCSRLHCQAPRLISRLPQRRREAEREPARH